MGSHICRDCGDQVPAVPGFVHYCRVRERRAAEARLADYQAAQQAEALAGRSSTSLEGAIESLVYTLPDPPARVSWSRRLVEILSDAVDERARQEAIGVVKRAEGIDWRSCADPEMAGGDGTRFLVLGEEVGEVANAVLEAGYGNGGPGDEHLREELVQTIAVAIAWVEAIDARSGR